MPIYPLYALLFADTGLSDAQISVLFALWSAVGIVAEVPSGALADRVGRRTALVTGALVQAVGYACWVVFPGFPGFAAGFVLWGLGSAFASGAQEALLHDGLAAVGAEAHYARVQGWVGAAGLAVQVPTAGIATALFVVGGYAAAGWASVATCIATAAVAARLPETPQPGRTSDRIPDERHGRRNLTDDLPFVPQRSPNRPTWRRCARASGRSPPGRRSCGPCSPSACCTASTRSRSTSRSSPVTCRSRPLLVPAALLAVPLVGALGAALGGPANRLGAGALAAVLATGAVLLALAAAVPHPVALGGVALFYGLYRAVLVVADARLQERITGPARATVTSVANVVAELPVVRGLRGVGAGRHGGDDGAGRGWWRRLLPVLLRRAR